MTAHSTGKPKTDDSCDVVSRPMGARIWVPAVCLVFAAGALAFQAQAPHDLAAHTRSSLGPDFDADGLADSMEMLLGTDVDSPDTDGDGFDDLEEVARFSDPLDDQSRPGLAELTVANYAYTEGGIFNFHAAIYIEDGNFADLSYELGIVIDGVKMPVSESSYSGAVRAFFYSGVNGPTTKLLVIEMPIPEYLVTRLEDFSIYSIVRDNALTPRSPVIDVMNLDQIEGMTMQITAAPVSMNVGGGVIYRPLSGEGGGGAAATGQVCWKRVAAVGTNGSSIVFEVEAASCEDFDSSCSGNACSSNVGGVVTMPDPGTLLGG